MKVLFVYKYLTLGGVETVLRARLEGLHTHGVDAHCWFFHDLGGRRVFEDFEDRVRVGPPDDRGFALATRDFDLVSTIDTEEIFPFLLRRQGASVDTSPALVVECHSAYQESQAYLHRVAALAPRAIFVPSEHQARVVRERVGNCHEIRVVPNPLAAPFASEPTLFPAPPPRPVLAWIGRLDDLKNWSGLLELLALLTQRGVDAEGWLVGRPSQSDGKALCRRARECGVLDRIRWFRGLPHRRIPGLLDAVRDSGGALVVTSRGESFGMTVAEAMARACPVVVPAQPPFSELVDGDNGLLVPPDAPVAAAAVAELLNDRPRQTAMGLRGRSAVLARFGPDFAVNALARELRRAMRLNDATEIASEGAAPA